MSIYPTTQRLPLHFDVARLQQDAAQFSPSQWQKHFNTHIYEGDWSGVALRMLPNAAVPLFPDPSSRQAFVDAPAMAQTSYVSEVLRALHCEVNSVRFLKLAAGSSIKRHRDYLLGIEDGEVRLHIPVQTNELVEFYMDDVVVPMAAGELWFLNFNHFHSVLNRSALDRIHLVIDCTVNDWLLAVLQRTVALSPV
jgi:Aspartyl/Asparaginyl beta-hydroxylase